MVLLDALGWKLQVGALKLWVEEEFKSSVLVLEI
jgi:hypothetical protein